MGYTSTSHHMQYSPLGSTYSPYSPTFFTTGTQAALHWPTNTANPLQYSVRPPPRSTTLPSQPRAHSRTAYYGSSAIPQQRSSHAAYGSNISADPMILETEDQESANSESMLSESIEPALAGYPKVEDFDDLMRKYAIIPATLQIVANMWYRYVSQLSPKKQDKALIHARRAANIRTVLVDKKTTTVESAQFRQVFKARNSTSLLTSMTDSGSKKCLCCCRLIQMFQL